VSNAEQRDTPQERVPRDPEGASDDAWPLNALLLSDRTWVRTRQTGDYQKARERLQKELHVPNEGRNAPELLPPGGGRPRIGQAQPNDAHQAGKRESRSEPPLSGSRYDHCAQGGARQKPV
jgi:hypothetical protein